MRNDALAQAAASFRFCDHQALFVPLVRPGAVFSDLRSVRRDCGGAERLADFTALRPCNTRYSIFRVSVQVQRVLPCLTALLAQGHVSTLVGSTDVLGQR